VNILVGFGLEALQDLSCCIERGSIFPGPLMISKTIRELKLPSGLKLDMIKKIPN
jgi:hypothetical protein